MNDASKGPVVGPDSEKGDRPDGELTVLGHYRLLGLIGRGGMGDVYRAHDESCNRTVAVKVLPPDLASDPTFVQRFEREAKAVAALSHPNIVPVYSIGEDQGHRYFSMAYIEGESLEDLLRRKKKLPLRETLHIVTQCLSALEAAHNKGLIHRDIKPGNVLLQRHTGRAYLVDFGLVRQISETTRVTATGMVMGTVDYMAPEQARGMKDIDQRADLYAIGALLYHLLSGRLPFESTTLEGMMYGHAYEEPHPLGEAAPDLPHELVELVHRLLAKDRDARPADCQEVIEALAPLQELDFQVRHLSGQLRSVASASESVAAAAGGDIPKSYGQLGRMRDRVTTIFRRPSPELLEALESADKELQPAIAECEQRRLRLAALRDEGRSLLEELQEQIQANLQAASEAMQQVEAADSDDARTNALAQKKACDEHVAVLQAQSHELGERLDELDLQLAKVDADLVTLQSRQGAVQGRIAVVKRAPRRLPVAAFFTVAVALLVAILIMLLVLNFLRDDTSTNDNLVIGKQNRTVEEIVSDRAILLMNFEKETFYEQDGQSYVRDLSGTGMHGLCRQNVGYTPNGVAGGGLECRGGWVVVSGHKPLNMLSDYTLICFLEVSNPNKGTTLYGEGINPERALEKGVWRPTFVIKPLGNSDQINIDAVHNGNWDRLSLPPFQSDKAYFFAVRLRNAHEMAGELTVFVADRMETYELKSQRSQAIGGALLARMMRGMIDEFVIFDRALSDIEIGRLRAHVESGQPLPAPTPTDST